MAYWCIEESFVRALSLFSAAAVCSNRRSYKHEYTDEVSSNYYVVLCFVFCLYNGCFF